MDHNLPINVKNITKLQKSKISKYSTYKGLTRPSEKYHNEYDNINTGTNNQYKHIVQIF